MQLFVTTALVNHYYPNFISEVCHSLLFLQKRFMFALCSHLRFAFLYSYSVRAFVVSLWALFLLHQCIFRSNSVIDIVHIVALPSFILLHCLRRFLFGFLCALSLLLRPPPRPFPPPLALVGGKTGQAGLQPAPKNAGRVPFSDSPTHLSPPHITRGPCGLTTGRAELTRQPAYVKTDVCCACVALLVRFFFSQIHSHTFILKP